MTALPAVSTGIVKAPASKYKGLCHHCHKPGHYRPDCPDRAGNKSEAPSEEQPTTRTVTSSGGHPTLLRRATLPTRLSQITLSIATK